MQRIHKKLYLDFGENIEKLARKAERSIDSSKLSPSERLNVSFEMFLEATFQFAETYDLETVHRLFVAHLDGLNQQIGNASKGTKQ